MPVYVYQCGQCSSKFEEFFTSMAIAASAPTPVCVECGSPDARRCISQFAQLRPLSPGTGRAAYPTSWTQANAGDPETISYWKRRVEREMSEESRDPGLKVERELTAEKRWNEFVKAGSPLDGIKEAPGQEVVASGPRHDHGHDHPHPHAHDHGPSANASSPPEHSRSEAGSAHDAPGSSDGRPSTSAKGTEH